MSVDSSTIMEKGESPMSVTISSSTHGPITFFIRAEHFYLCIWKKSSAFLDFEVEGCTATVNLLINSEKWSTQSIDEWAVMWAAKISSFVFVQLLTADTLTTNMP